MKENPLRATDSASQSTAALINLVGAWESLPMGNYTPRTIQRWLSETMKPAFDFARAALNSDSMTTAHGVVGEQARDGDAQ